MKKRLLSLLAVLALIFTLAMPAALAADEDTMLETVRVLGILSGDENGNPEPLRLGDPGGVR